MIATKSTYQNLGPERIGPERYSLDGKVLYFYLFLITLGLGPGQSFFTFFKKQKKVLICLNFLIFHRSGNKANNYEKIISDVYF